MTIYNRTHIFLLLSLTLGLIANSLWAEEDGKGTNVVRNLRIEDQGTLTLSNVAIKSWADVAGSAVDLQARDTANWASNQAVTLNSATNVINTDVTNLSYQVTNVVYAATNALNTAVGNLNARTNYWNNGVIITAGSGALVAGNLYCMTNGSTVWTAANASTNVTAEGIIGLALATEASPTNGLLLNGQYIKNSHGFNLGAPIYLDTVNYGMTSTRPTGTNQIVRIVGYAIDANTIMFNPDRTYVEILGD